MITWTSDELTKIESAEELQLQSLRRDGILRDPVTMWMARVGDDVYVRCVNGRTGAWFRGVLTCHQGRIRAGGVQKDVTFVELDDPEINAQIDAAYRARYRRYPQYVAPLLVPAAHAATLKLVPQEK
ncbi:MAG: DUF2255 family protein [Anaerolineales bacterium]|nr:DUF2255 family protein [Anaerolineales bacterium]